MVTTLTNSKQRITNPEILSAKSSLTAPIQGTFIYTGLFEGPNDFMELNLDIVDLVSLEISLSGYPFLTKNTGCLMNLNIL